MRHSPELIAKIEREYVYGVYRDGKLIFPTLKELAARYEIPYDTLRRYSSKFHWEDKRRSASPEVLFKNSQELLETVQKAAEDAEAIEKAADMGIQVCTRLLEIVRDMVVSGENVRGAVSMARTISEALKNYSAVKTAVAKPAGEQGELRYVVEFTGLKESDTGNQV